MAEQESSAGHWDTVYATRDLSSLSWHQDAPTTSLRLIGSPRNSLLDIGSGASALADHLLTGGWQHLTLLDVSAEGLALTRRRLGPDAARVTFVVRDLLDWEPPGSVDVWHDRAVLHFLTDPGDRARYVELASRAVVTGGRVVIGGFSPEGPTRCSGLATARRSAAQLATEFGAGFALEHDELEAHLTPSGAQQSFTWVVLRRLA